MAYTQKVGVPECLKDHLMVDTRSIEYARDAAANAFVPHKLKNVQTRNNFHFVHSQAFLNDVSLCYTCYGNELTVTPEPMGEFYLVQLPAHGNVDIRSGNCRSRLTGSTGSIISPMNQNRFHWSENAGVISIKIERHALEHQMRRLIQSEVNGGIEFQLEMHLASPAYRNWYIEVVRLMQYFQSTKHSELVALEGWFEQKLIEMLLVSHPSNYSKFLTNGNYQAPPKSVGIAIDYMNEYFMEKITLATLSSVTGVTSRTLHNGFKRYRNVSPMEYLLEIRLRKAKTALSKANDGSSVTEIAQAAGFSHLGRFSQQFFQEYGELPSDTLKQSVPRKF